MTPNHKIILLLLHNYNFATVMNYIAVTDLGELNHRDLWVGDDVL